MENILSEVAVDNSLHISQFRGVFITPGDEKDIGQDLEVTANDYIASLPIETNCEYSYNYELIITRKKV